MRYNHIILNTIDLPALGLPMADQPAPVDFEQSLTQLEALVEKLENSEFTLEQSLQAFEQGVTLTRQCQKALSEAEQKVQLLIEQNGQSQAQKFENNELPTSDQ
jgi:exodeoxyribonuclease VII small subunit